jgi:CheY-like chemotaxis protein
MSPEFGTARPILLAEDFEADAVAVQRLLRKVGVGNPVIVVPDGGEAIAYMNNDGPFRDRQKFPLPDMLLLDLKLPTKNGFEVLEWCRTQPHLKELFIVVLSGHYELELRDINQAYLLGAHTFLAKPASQKDILNAIKDRLNCSQWSVVLQAN